MNVHVKIFAILKERTGVGEFDLQLRDVATIKDAIKEIGKKFPTIADFLPRVAAAVNLNYAATSTILHDGDELALIPPVSGG